MKLSQLVALVSISIDRRFKKFENLAKGSQYGGSGGVSRLNWTLASSSISNDGSLKILP
jgi:hypothetical protein